MRQVDAGPAINTPRETKMMSIPMYQGSLPALTTEQMVEVDRLMIQEYRIELIQMMENAGRALAHLARARFLAGDPQGRRVVVLAGGGGNGGGALVCARRLHGWGASIDIVLAVPDSRMNDVPAHQLDILRRMDLGSIDAADIGRMEKPELIIDGIIGYSLSGAPREAAADLIRWANACPAPVLALDLPSGLDASRGKALEPAIRAAATLTLALPKRGLMEPGVEELVGELYLGDISVPPGLYQRSSLGIEVGPIFRESDVLRLK